MEYAVLDPARRQIRLLHLHAGALDSEIDGHLRTVSLHDTDLDYEALSYVWGESNEGRFLNIRGRRIPVTDNLWEALQVLRYINSERVIWVDALCINQLDDDERSAQVALMSAVYGKASSVEIWLGEPFDNIELALQFFEDFAKDVSDTDVGTGHSYVTMGLDHEDFDENTLTGDALKSYETLMAIKEIFQASWWYRTWTVQEFILARTAKFRCGYHKINGATLMQCVWHCARHELSQCACGLPAEWADALDDYFDPGQQLCRLQTVRMSLLECVGVLRSRDASDPRDKIYGVLGLDFNASSDLVRSNYSFPVAKVYEDFAMSLINSTKRLDILSYIIAEEDSESTLASFVPDWRSDDHGWSPRPHLVEAYNAGYSSEIIFKAQPGMLSVKGLIVDTIQSVASDSLHDSSTGFVGTPGILDELLDMAADSTQRGRQDFWIAMCGGISLEYKHYPLRLTEYSKTNTLVASYKRIESISQRRYEGIEQFIRSMEQGKETYLGAVEKLDDSAMDGALAIAHSLRKGMITDRGLFGFVPLPTKAGDVVAVLTGARVPIILRPGSGCYTVLGDAYVHGIMDGEAMQGAVNELEWLELH